MLTIENIEKIKQYAFDVVWSCDNVHETPTGYHFVVERRNISGKIDDVRKIILSRVDIPYMDEKEMCYQLYLDDKKLGHVVTPSFLKEVNNLVNTFTEILGRI
jgi:hypothetical protein